MRSCRPSPSTWLGTAPARNPSSGVRAPLDRIGEQVPRVWRGESRVRSPETGTQPEFSPSAPQTGRPTQADAPAPSSVHRALLTSKPTGAQEQKSLHIGIFVMVSKIA